MYVMFSRHVRLLESIYILFRSDIGMIFISFLIFLVRYTYSLVEQ